MYIVYKIFYYNKTYIVRLTYTYLIHIYMWGRLNLKISSAQHSLHLTEHSVALFRSVFIITLYVCIVGYLKEENAVIQRFNESAAGDGFMHTTFMKHIHFRYCYIHYIQSAICNAVFSSFSGRKTY